MHIIFESVLMLSTKKLSKLVRPCGNYSMPNLARFLRHSVYCDKSYVYSILGSFNTRAALHNNTKIKQVTKGISEPVPVALLVASRYALPGYGDRRVWVRGPDWSDHCVRL